MDLVNEYLKSLSLEDGKHVYDGFYPPFDFDIVDILGCTNYRLTKKFHQQYNYIWSFENRISMLPHGSWRIYLDELIRLLKSEGKIILRIKNNGNVNLIEIKHYLYRKINIETELLYELTNETFDDIAVFKIKRNFFDIYSNSEWTFAILTTGNKVNNVVSFLNSISKLPAKTKYEILILGPGDERYGNEKVRYLDTTIFRDNEYAEISKKKNFIIENAKYENVMIVHDRYILSDNFLEGFDTFGYDFDFITLNQRTLSNIQFPSLAYTNEKLKFSGQVMIQNYNNFYENMYINGGLFIIKSTIAKLLKFNNLLFWGQMEDVEFSLNAIQNGIVPRINLTSSVIVLEHRADYMESWINENDLIKRNIYFSQNLTMLDKIVLAIPLSIRNTLIYRKIVQKIKRIIYE